MIFKVYYQEVKDRSPRRESTRSLYLDIDAKTELEGRIQARELVENNTDYNIELIEALSENHLAYEKENANFELTEFPS
ncbi:MULTISPECIES: DNA-directed RNA polymerase subunit epsilon [unclassified Streptococcus]|uniref:DNA-dependent RNA polymerase subunit epsilon n=1 Tax=unclassified Streptococcus TaxID=2608887 RepID=UPI0018AC2BD6|nr:MULTISPECIES: DNA-directed RNA polymerase subunit epsilon [unclassified Streptococcus]MBF8971002.1 DNA-dependent RNA polymerase auxiliary subunit epsilon family protein [Streptococcus sp. NLN76]MBG9368100.1 DNA-dependent RNA polymerase auxiliary subunit epsilon family protein [Streptococcus sp. NLN64]MBJ6746462.1 DNA-dependent RNA polymerase auxiliary subunit epsilon family protein [Streptococcus sp. 121]